jgi:hypothetical protein
MKPKCINGLVKAEVFGFVIVLVCCSIGLNTRGGPREIGASVTKAVVTSLILILVLDYFVTKALLFCDMSPSFTASPFVAHRKRLRFPRVANVTKNFGKFDRC